MVGILAAPSVVASLELRGAKAAGAAVLIVLACVGGTFGMVVCCKLGGPKPRGTPTQLWEEQRCVRAEGCGGKGDWVGVFIYRTRRHAPLV